MERLTMVVALMWCGISQLALAQQTTTPEKFQSNIAPLEEANGCNPEMTVQDLPEINTAAPLPFDAERKGYSAGDCVVTGMTRGMKKYGSPGCLTQVRYLCAKGGIFNPQDYDVDPAFSTVVLYVPGGQFAQWREAAANPPTTVERVRKGPVTGIVEYHLSGGWCEGEVFDLRAKREAGDAAQKKYRDMDFKDDECRYTGANITVSRYGYCKAEASYYCYQVLPSQPLNL